MTENSIIIANNIKAERCRKNISQSDTAKFLGIDRRTYIKYEKNASKISVTTLAMLANLFKCSVSDFYLHTDFTKCEDND